MVLTYNRIDSLRKLLTELDQLTYPQLEVLVVDNCSEIPADSLGSSFPSVVFVRSPGNIGTGGRNIGMARATGEIIVGLDDDVSGLTDDALWRLSSLFRDAQVAAICFKVIEAVTGNITNWVHHKPVERFADEVFETYEITEGAVAFRRKVVVDIGGYPDSFFISHEGPDLALRMIDRGSKVLYNPTIAVVHAYSPLARTSWRNYYFDTRNTFWLAARNCPFVFGMQLIFRQTGAMMIYAIRDGFFTWWLRGVRDGLAGLPKAFRERRRISPATMKKVREMDGDRPTLLYLIKRRLFQRGIKI